MREIRTIIFVFCLMTWTILNSQSPDYVCETEVSIIQERTVDVFNCTGVEILDRQEIVRLPRFVIDVAFHFLPDSMGYNFTCDPDDPILDSTSNSYNLYVPDYLDNIIQHMNKNSHQFIIDDFPSQSFLDSRIKFRLANIDHCENIRDSVVRVPNALNVIYRNYVSRSGGLYEAPNIFMFGRLFRYLEGDPSNTSFDDATVLLHEWGHSAGLDHAHWCDNKCKGIDIVPEDNCNGECIEGFVNDGCWQGSLKGLTMAQGPYDNFTKCEWSEVAANYIAGSFSHGQRCVEEYPLDPAYVLNTGSTVEWGDPRAFNSDIVIRRGTDLVVKCILEMANNAKIIVERGASLTLDGGCILSHCPDGQWQGIIVEGVQSESNNANAFSNSGRVFLVAGATIENAKTGISMKPSHRPWVADPQDPGYWSNFYGGFVLSNESTFRNCNRAVEFMQYGTGSKRDRSSFSNTTFENIKNTAVTIWENNGVKFTDCTFNNCGTSGILAANSQIFVDSAITGPKDANFSDMPVGIEMLLLSQDVSSPGSQIHNNKFDCDATGIELIATNASSADVIANNTFLDKLSGIVVIGNSNFDINNNTFDGQGIGLIVSDGNGGDNPVRKNEFKNSGIGAFTTGDNRMTQFTSNCFSVNQQDIRNSRIGFLSDQGDSKDEAGNCFSGLTVPEIYNEAAEFSYFIHEELIDTDACEDTDEALGIIEDAAEEANSSDGCGSNITLFKPDNECELKYTDPQDLIQLIQQADAALADLISLGADDYDIGLMENLKRSLLHQLGQSILNDHQASSVYDEQFLFQFYQQRPEFSIRSLVPSIHISKGDYIAARQTLNSIEASTQIEADYKEVQHIYLDFLESNFSPVPGHSLNRLREIGVKDGPLNGYARSVLYFVSGEKLPLDLPDMDLLPRELDDKDESISINLYPNPAKDLLWIEIKNADTSSFYEMEIYDQDATLRKSIRVQGPYSVTMDLGELHVGMYIVRVMNDSGKEIHMEKLVILK